MENGSSRLTTPRFERRPGKGEFPAPRQDHGTNHGKPQCVVIGVEGYDMEEVVLMVSPGFWKMIEARRGQPRIPLREFERELSDNPPIRRNVRRASRREVG